MNDNVIENHQKSIEWALFLLRLGVFIVMFAWTIDKILNPAHGAKVFEHFYFIKDFGGTLMMAIGVVELFIILAFLTGLWKRVTYGIILIIHSVSTISAWEKYTVDISLLFFAAWPMLAACAALYMLRDLDVKFTLASLKK